MLLSRNLGNGGLSRHKRFAGIFGINGENPDEIGVFTGYIYFGVLLWLGWVELNHHGVSQSHVSYR